MLVTNITKRIDIAHEEGQFAIIRKLSHKQLRVAKEEQDKKNVEGMRALGGELLKAIMTAKSSADVQDKMRQAEDAIAALASTYDRDSILAAGLASWSYDITPGQEGAIGMLDETTAKFLHEALVSYAREGGATKNDSSSSIAS